MSTILVSGDACRPASRVRGGISSIRVGNGGCVDISRALALECGDNLLSDRTGGRDSATSRLVELSDGFVWLVHLYLAARPLLLNVSCVLRWSCCVGVKCA